MAQALPAELERYPDTEIAVFLPYYESIKENDSVKPEFICSFHLPLAWRQAYAGIFMFTLSERRRIYFIDNEYYFKRDGAYGYYDDGERYAFFCRALLEALPRIDFVPDVIHANDWQTAAIPVFLSAIYSHAEPYRRIKTLFTIHNIEYQGKAPLEFMQDVMGLPPHHLGVTELDGCVNLMKGGIETADMVTTVSESYARELEYAYHAHGLHNVISANRHKLVGIPNGIDTEVFDPSSDRYIAARYTAGDISGKAVCKAALQGELALDTSGDTPIIAVVSRLAGHKGIELIQAVFDDIMSIGVQFVLLGCGDVEYERFFEEQAKRYNSSVSASISFDTALSHRIYAGADMLLMPSKSEPCGLAQLIAMRYGTIPIVHETGGLRDSVSALDPSTGNGRGFTFRSYNAHDMLDAIRRCCDFWHNVEFRTTHISKLIGEELSWRIPAQKYRELYLSLLQKR